MLRAVFLFLYGSMVSFYRSSCVCSKQVPGFQRRLCPYPFQTYIRSGSYAALPPLPWTPGTDGAGRVAAVGPVCWARIGGFAQHTQGVSGLQPGQNVWLTAALTGTYAQYCLCAADSLRLLPGHLSFSQGAAINIPYRTAYRALFMVAPCNVCQPH